MAMESTEAPVARRRAEDRLHGRIARGLAVGRITSMLTFGLFFSAANVDPRVPMVGAPILPIAAGGVIYRARTRKASKAIVRDYAREVRRSHETVEADMGDEMSVRYRLDSVFDDSEAPQPRQASRKEVSTPGLPLDNDQEFELFKGAGLVTAATVGGIMDSYIAHGNAPPDIGIPRGIGPMLTTVVVAAHLFEGTTVSHAQPYLRWMDEIDGLYDAERPPEASTASVTAV